jgi:PiT family inorganic phosphate transporter
VSVAEGPLAYLVIIASLIAAYIALNVGAKRCGQQYGAAVGSRALPVAGAIGIAAVVRQEARS